MAVDVARARARGMGMVVALAFVLVASAAARVHAQPAPQPPPAGEPAPAPLRAVVRVATEDDEDILSRLRGHVSDLAVDLVVEPGELERKERKRRGAAARLARRAEARAVVWFTPLKPGGYRVHVADVERHQLLEKDVAADEGRPVDRSALLETAALVVRSAFFAMQEGTDIGPPEQFKEEEEPPDLKPPPPPPPPPRREPLAIAQMAVGGEWAFDGAPGGYPGLLARASLVRGRFGVELGVHLPFTAQIHGDFADVSLWRVPIWLGLDVRVARPTPALAFHVAVRGAAIVYQRTTDEVFGGATATPEQTTLAGGVGPELRVELQIVNRLRLELTVGAEAVAHAPELNYQRANDSLQFAKLWLVQPHVGLNLLFR
jgi:hypothetical protein